MLYGRRKIAFNSNYLTQTFKNSYREKKKVNTGRTGNFNLIGTIKWTATTVAAFATTITSSSILINQWSSRNRYQSGGYSMRNSTEFATIFNQHLNKELMAVSKSRCFS
jgi:hypothetical protein